MHNFCVAALTALQSDDDELPALMTSAKFDDVTGAGVGGAEDFGSTSSLISRSSARK